MIMHAYSIYDRKVEMFNPPFFARTDGEAIRSFSDLCHDKSTTPGKYPDDFTLAHVGLFNDSNGHLEPANPRFLAKENGQ